MAMALRAGGLLLCAALSLPAAGHEVAHVVSARSAVVVELRYADGEPFAFEAYEVSQAGGERPFHVGRTDAAGRAVFLPPADGEVRLRAFSEDGHGADLRFPPPREASATAGAVAAEVRAANAASGELRLARGVLGLAVLLALFAALRRFLRRGKRLPEAAS